MRRVLGCAVRRAWGVYIHQMSSETCGTLLAYTPTTTPYWAYTADTGVVYCYQGGWSHRGFDTKAYDLGGNPYYQGYYNEWIVPLSLVAKIMAASDDGKTLTLSKNANVSATNANVYTDCVPAFENLIENDTCNVTGGKQFSSETLPEIVAVPTGRFAMSRRVSVGPRPYLIIEGQGIDDTTFFSPKGCPLVGFSCNNILFPGPVTFRKLRMVGNHSTNGYMTTVDQNGTWQFGGSIYMVQCAWRHGTKLRVRGYVYPHR